MILVLLFLLRRFFFIVPFHQIDVVNSWKTFFMHIRSLLVPPFNVVYSLWTGATERFIFIVSLISLMSFSFANFFNEIGWALCTLPVVFCVPLHLYNFFGHLLCESGPYSYIIIWYIKINYYWYFILYDVIIFCQGYSFTHHLMLHSRNPGKSCPIIASLYYVL